MTILFSRIIPREQFLVVHASIRHIENTIAARAPTPTGTPGTWPRQRPQTADASRPKKLREGIRNLRWCSQRNHRIVAHVHSVSLAEPCCSHVDSSKDTPHVSTHPYTTFDHSSPLARP